MTHAICDDIKAKYIFAKQQTVLMTSTSEQESISSMCNLFTSFSRNENLFRPKS